ncbi:MAG TPA: tetratricopeptide repeat protein, partial [Caldilineaceae bacterium]|nr:tetratricopeptide repeat protein [Caldilineaceae bacterium]
MARNSTENFPSWALWIMGLLTVLAAALLVLSIVLGVRAGQRQLEIQRRQDAAIALADAIDLHAGGDYAAALDAYKHVLQLEPDNSAAREGIQNVLTMMRGVQPAPPVAAATSAAVAISGTVAPAVATTAPADTPATVSATSGSQEVTTSADALLQAATTAFGAGRWQEAISRLVALKQADAAYQPDRVNGMLVDAYVNLAAEKDNEDNLEEALAYFDKALELRPNDASL